MFQYSTTTTATKATTITTTAATTIRATITSQKAISERDAHGTNDAAQWANNSVLLSKYLRVEKEVVALLFVRIYDIPKFTYKLSLSCKKILKYFKWSIESNII